MKKSNLTFNLLFAGFILLILAIPFGFADPETSLKFSNWVAEDGSFTVDGVVWSVVPTEDIQSVVLRSSIGVASMTNNSCYVLSKYKTCLKAYRFSRGGTERVHGPETEEFFITVDSLFKTADLKITRTASKSTLFIGESARITTRITNAGGSLAKDIQYVEEFPNISKATPALYQLDSSKLVWEGNLDQGKSVDFYYDILFNDNGSYKVPATLDYFDGEIKKNLQNDLNFNILNAYDVTFIGTSAAEIGEQKHLEINLVENLDNLMDIRLKPSEGIHILNSSFETRFGETYFKGNLSSLQNFSVDYVADSEGPKFIELDVGVWGASIYQKYFFNVNVSNQKLDADLVSAPDDQNTIIKLFLKNNNGHLQATEIEIGLSSSLYSRQLTVSQLNPYENSFVLTDKVPLSKYGSQKIDVDIRYVLFEKKYRLQKSFDLLNKAPLVKSMPQVNGTNNLNSNSSVNIDVNISVPTIDSTPQENILAQNEIPVAVANDPHLQKASEKNIFEKLIDWFDSLFK